MSEGDSFGSIEDLTFLDGTFAEVTEAKLDFASGWSEGTFVRADKSVGAIVKERLQELPECKPLGDGALFDLTIPEAVVEGMLTTRMLWARKIPSGSPTTRRSTASRVSITGRTTKTYEDVLRRFWR